MKLPTSALLLVLALAIAPALTSCTTARKRPQTPESPATTGAPPADGKTVASGEYNDLDEYEVIEIPDPLEPVNRVIFVFNDGVYTYVLRPVARGYKTVVPKAVRHSLKNVFENARFPVRFVNNLLQAEFHRAGMETGKFLMNSTVGLGGILKPSEQYPEYVDIPPADTGQTLAKWGIPHGCYLVLPILGPSSPREAVGLAGNTALNPVSWVGFWYGGGFFVGPDWTIAIGSAHAMHNLPDHIDTYDAATEDALEKYLAVRSAWLQYRAAMAEK